MLICPIWFPNDSVHVFFISLFLMLPDYILLILFLKSVAFAENTRIMPEPTEEIDKKQSSRTFQICYIWLD